jgi:hypothetical protein
MKIYSTLTPAHLGLPLGRAHRGGGALPSDPGSTNGCRRGRLPAAEDEAGGVAHPFGVAYQGPAAPFGPPGISLPPTSAGGWAPSSCSAQPSQTCHTYRNRQARMFGL